MASDQSLRLFAATACQQIVFRPHFLHGTFWTQFNMADTPAAHKPALDKFILVFAIPECFNINNNIKLLTV
jgi:hypothetical protein